MDYIIVSGYICYCIGHVNRVSEWVSEWERKRKGDIERKREVYVRIEDGNVSLVRAQYNDNIASDRPLIIPNLNFLLTNV